MVAMAERKYVTLHNQVGPHRRGDVISRANSPLLERPQDVDRFVNIGAIREATEYEAQKESVKVEDLTPSKVISEERVNQLLREKGELQAQLIETASRAERLAQTPPEPLRINAEEITKGIENALAQLHAAKSELETSTREAREAVEALQAARAEMMREREAAAAQESAREQRIAAIAADLASLRDQLARQDQPQKRK